MAVGKSWQNYLPGRKPAAFAVLAIGVLNLVFASALAGVVRTQLDYQEVKAGAPTVCLLNVKGQVCVFTYITAGAIFFFTLLQIIPVAYFYKKGDSLYPVYLSLAIFSFFWQLVMSITITIRGRQAMSSGLPQQSSREAAWAFAWLGTVLSLFAAITVILDLVRESQANTAERKLKKNDTIDVGNVAFMNSGVGIGSV